jgi:hypothetical protein
VTADQWTLDLVVLAADKDIEYALRGVLTRQHSLGIREISVEFLTHPNRDPGCLLTSHEILSTHVRRAAHALVAFDREGCGKDELTPQQLESEVVGRLTSSGWGDRAAAIVIDPEVEIWVWSDSPEVDAALGWTGREPALRRWLVNQGFLSAGGAKPQSPKEALESALREVGKPASSAVFLELAQSVSLARCNDPSFLRLRQTLCGWFAETDS